MSSFKIKKIALITAVSLLLTIFFIYKDYSHPQWSPDGKRLILSYLHLFKYDRGISINDGMVIIDIENKNRINITKDIQGEDAKWAPNGQKILFTCYKEKPSQSNICIFYISKEKINFITNDNLSRNPQWSPDGKQIIFTSKRSGERNTYITKHNDFTQANLVQQNGIVWGASWSPDGEQIAFQHITGINKERRICTAKTKTLNNAKCLDVSGRPVWSPDSKKIIFSPHDREINVMDSDGSNLIELISTSTYISAYNPVWAPDSQQIVFFTVKSLPPGSQPLFNPFESKIYIVNVNDPKSIRYIAEGYNPVWSPDGKQIAFSNNGRIILMNLDNSKLTYLP